MNDGTGRTGPRRAGALVAALAGIALLLTACGNGSPAATGSQNYQKAVAFAQCMRSHGALGFPDPSSLGTFDIQQIDVNSPLITAAFKPCQKLFPPGAVSMPVAQQRKMEDQALQYAVCLRSHGYPNFPDPRFQAGPGGVSVEFQVGPPMGIDPKTPQFQAAAQICKNLTGFAGP